MLTETTRSGSTRSGRVQGRGSSSVASERRALALCRLANRFDYRRDCIEWRYPQAVSFGDARWELVADDTVVIIDCPVDYAENMKLTHRLKAMTSPL